MAKWARSGEMNNASVTRAEYEEYGAEYFKVHGMGNAA
jgi:actin-related protein